MQIEQPYYFLALLLIPVVAWLYIRNRRWRNKVLQQFGEWMLVVQLIPGNSSFRPLLKLILQLTAFILIITGLTNIQSGNATRNIRHEGIDLAIVLDVSNSMLAEDELPNRLEAAKKFGAQLIDQLPDARIALITFAGIPVLQTPLTIDHTAAQLLLSAISVDDVPEQGSDIGAALQEAIKALPENQQRYRAVVLISDGEDQEGNLEDALEAIRQDKIAVCCVGIGSETGATIPVVSDGTITDKRDAAGNRVVTTFRPGLLKAIAENSSGVFVKMDASGNEVVSKIVLRLDSINKNQLDEQLLVAYESQFQWFLLPALLLLFAELLISNKNVVWFKKKRSG